MSLNSNNNNWIECTLGDIVTFKRGYDLPKDKMNKGKYPVVGSNGIIGYHDEFTTKSPGITVGRSGNVGKPFIVKGDSWSHNTTLFVEKFKNVDPYFVYYYLKTIDLKQFAGGSAVPTLNRNHIHPIDIRIPRDINEQKKISTLLLTIDEKIAVCESINKNLEEQLLKIFDSWFVKFDLSDEFVESPIGLIPKGWSVDHLGSKKSCSIIGSGIDDFDNSKIYIATADVDNSIITNNETLITMENKPSRANMQPIEKSIWFAKMIDSRKLIMVDDYCYDLLNNYIFSTGFCGLKCAEDYFYYLWTFLLSESFDTIKNNFCTGTTMQAINNKDTKLIEFVLPDNELLFKFNNIAEPIYQEIYYNNLEIKKLQKLRDTLLPKLMSGEIDVSKINRDLE